MECGEDPREGRSESFGELPGVGSGGGAKDKVLGRPARTFRTMKDLEHYAQEFGFIRMQREAWE